MATVAAFAAFTTAAVGAATISEQRSSRKDQAGAQRRTEERLAEAERNRVKAQQESEFAIRQKRQERRGGFTTTQGASLLGGTSLLG